MKRVAFLPDWRAGNSYQSALGEALLEEGYEAYYSCGYRRGLPLARANLNGAALMHLHWPEAFFSSRGDRLGWIRRWRFPIDLALACRKRPLVYTAHNLLPHGVMDSYAIRRNYRAVLARSRTVFTHSNAAAQKLASFAPSTSDRIQVIPHGDPAAVFPALPARNASRMQLGIRAEEPLVLMFGRVEPYKGIENIIAAWSRLHSHARLWISGAAADTSIAEKLRKLAAPQSRVTLELKRLADEDLATRLAASDLVLFNYLRLLTSGAGCLARSLGKRILLPKRLDAVDLMEPSKTVFRFDSTETDLSEVLIRALATPDDPDGTARWRAATAWRTVAQKTAEGYRRALGIREVTSRVGSAKGA